MAPANTLNGTETSTGGVTVATGAALTQIAGGVLTGNLIDNGTTTLNGTVSNNVSVNSAILNGTGGMIGGTLTFTGTGNTLSGTQTRHGWCFDRWRRDR